MTSSSSLYGAVNEQNTQSTNSTSLYGGADTPIPTPAGDLIVRGDLYVLSGNILTTATTGNIFPANATTVNLGLAATAVNIGASTGTTTINNDLQVTGTFIAPSADFGNITIAVADDNTITTTTGDLKLASATNKLNLNTNTGFTYAEGGSAFNRPYFQSTTGNSSGLRVIAPNTGTSSSAALSALNSSDTQNAQLLSVQSYGSAITDPLRIVSGKYTSGVFGPTGQSIAFRDGTTTYATVNPAGTTISTDLATKAYVDSQELNTTYTINASTTTGGANFNLVGSDATTDTIKYSSGTGVTVSRTDASTINFAIGQSVATTANPTFAGATLGAIKVGVTTDNTIDTTSGNLTIAPATGIITVAAPTTVQYAEGGDRTKRFQFQSSTGNSSGVRVMAPNATTSAQSTIGAFSSNDNANGSFINLRANNSGTDPLRILTGTYTSGVLGASSGAAFVDNVTTYATVNPSGPTNNLDLITKQYFESNLPDPSQLVNGSYTFTLNADGTVNTPSTIYAVGPLTLRGGALNPTNLVLDDNTSTTTLSGGLGGDTSILTASDVSLTWAHTANPLNIGSVSGTWSYNLNGTTSFPNYTFPYADGSANQVLKTNGSGVLSWYTPSDLNTTYTIDASATTGGANLNLVGSDASTDTVKISSGTGVTVAQVNANELSVAIGQAVGTSDNVSFAGVTLDSMVNLNTATLTTSTTAADQVADSFVAATYRTCKYVIQISSGSAYQAVEALLVHDGSTAYINTYSDVRTGANLTSIGAAVNGANIELQVTPVNAATTYKISKTLIAV